MRDRPVGSVNKTMDTFAVIESGGKQYRVRAGDVVRVEKIADLPAVPAQAGREGGLGSGAKIAFDKVLLKAEGERVELGAPYLGGAVVEGEVRGNVRGERKMVFRYHSKTRYRKKKTHRQPYTEVKITKV